MSTFNVTAVDVGAPTHPTVASVFWDFMNSSGTVWDGSENVQAPLFVNPFYATGYPLTEAYWTNVLVGGVAKRVLVQVFERRVLTYTPSNPTGWQVEAGNVGQHYYTWRYNLAPTIGSKAAPVPLGHTFDLGNSWSIKVVGVTANATSQVLAANQFNTAPPAGYQDFMVTVQAAYSGSGSSNWFHDNSSFYSVGASAVGYTTFDNDCGVAPNAFPEFTDVFTGGTVTGNVCWQIKSSDATSLIMYVKPGILGQYPEEYFALR